MFERPTTLILGAGASIPYGYPSGPDLLAGIQSSVEYGLDLLTADEFANINRGEHPFQIRSLKCLRDFAMKNGNGHESESLLAEFLSVDRTRELLDRLKSAHELQSIDEFANRYPSLANLAMLFVAHEIAVASFQFSMPRFELKPKISEVRPNGWYHYLARYLIDECESTDDLRRNKLKILTFNYDTSLEIYLASNLFKYEAFDQCELDEIVEIDHVYGSFDLVDYLDRKLTAEEYVEMILVGSGNLQLMYGEREEQDLERFEAKISESHVVMFGGYGFLKYNDRLLNLPAALEGRIVNATAYGGGDPARSRGLHDLLFYDWGLHENQIFDLTFDRAIEERFFDSLVSLPVQKKKRQRKLVGDHLQI